MESLHGSSSRVIIPMLRIHALLILAVALLFAFNSWLSINHFDQYQAITDLEKEQKEIIEENKQLITAISLLRSPKRIAQKIHTFGDLQLLTADQNIYLQEKEQ